MYGSFRTVGKVNIGCEAKLPACGSPEVDEGDLSVALENPDVKAALGTGSLVTDTFYGLDKRTAGGPVKMMLQDGPHYINVGDPCNDAPGCLAVPQGVAALFTLLRQLNREQGEHGECAGF
jgi:hypothetical protein